MPNCSLPCSGAGGGDMTICPWRSASMRCGSPARRESASTFSHTAFNLAVWEKVLADSLLAGLPHRIETDRHGQIVMSPPPAPEHGREQFGIGKRLDQLLPAGHVITEYPVSTSEGVKLVDVAWISAARRQSQPGQVCFIQAPEI